MSTHADEIIKAADAARSSRTIQVVADEYLAAKKAYGDYIRLRTELLELIGEAHSHDPNKCEKCRIGLLQSLYAGQGAGR